MSSRLPLIRYLIWVPSRAIGLFTLESPNYREPSRVIPDGETLHAGTYSRYTASLRKVRRTLLIVGAGLVIWQVTTLAVGSMAYLRHKNGKGIELSAEQSRLVASLLHPSETDIRDSIDKMAAARRTSQADGKTQPSEVALVSKLQAGDLDSARRQWSEKRDAIPRVASDRIAALLENLAEHRDDLDLETRLASALCSVSYRFGGLEAWAWPIVGPR